MEIFRIIGVGIITAITALIVRQVKPEISVIISITGGILMLLMIANSLTSVFDTFSQVIEKSGLTKGLFSTILKIVGVGYITEFSASLCQDAGVNSVADKILLGGKIVILVLALPIVSNIIEIISGLLPWKNLILKKTKNLNLQEMF